MADWFEEVGMIESTAAKFSPGGAINTHLALPSSTHTHTYNNHRKSSTVHTNHHIGPQLTQHREGNLLPHKSHTNSHYWFSKTCHLCAPLFGGLHKCTHHSINYRLYPAQNAHTPVTHAKTGQGNSV